MQVAWQTRKTHQHTSTMIPAVAQRKIMMFVDFAPEWLQSECRSFGRKTSATGGHGTSTFGAE
jgi:hypothetical protein